VLTLGNENVGNRKVADPHFILVEIEKIEIIKPSGVFRKFLQIIAMDLLIYINKKELRNYEAKINKNNM